MNTVKFDLDMYDHFVFAKRKINRLQGITIAVNIKATETETILEIDEKESPANILQLGIWAGMNFAIAEDAIKG